MNDPRQPQSVPPIPQRPPQQVQPMRPVQHAPPGQPGQRIPQAPHAPHVPPQQPGLRPPQTVPAMPARPAPAPINPHAGDTPLDLDPIEMEEVDEDSLVEAAPTKTKISFGADGHLTKRAYSRKPTMTGQGACRVRTFHGKLSDQGLEYLDDAINHFLDEHPEIEIKFVTSNVGMFDGKFKDIAMIVNVWY
jgi:hypothetical protein